MELTYQGLGFLDVLMPEQKLAVEVGEVDGVEIDDVDVAKSGEDEVLEQLAANAACTNHEDARLRLRVSQVSGAGVGEDRTSLMWAWSEAPSDCFANLSRAIVRRRGEAQERVRSGGLDM